ncbi:hypothetical protein IV203_038745 [Nitzschia inconspicua]|uniref:Uncharacterized protein n=1 Tax=Nitzschia inconspicua TaxID=303405 RepID=A0A9K3LRC4_9STRA|nr:hypothetical protein IV203_038745 [Nitzschia inconspicua]
MPTDEAKVSAHREWLSELGEGWPVDGIDLEDRDMMNDIYNHLGIQNDSSSRAQFRAYIKRHKQQPQQEKDPYKTARMKSQPEKNKLSPTLKRALEKLNNKQIDLNDLPTENEHKGWSDIEIRAELSPLELSAVQNYRKRLVQEQDNEIALPEDIDRVIRNYDSRKRQPFSSTRLNSDISTLYQYKDRPDFLTFRLGEQNYSDEATRAAIQKAMEKAPVCVAGVSGAGKTRTVLELLSARWGLYFSAGMYLAWGPQPDKPCSTDLAWIAENSATDLQKDTYTRTVQRLECAIVARFLILEKKLKTVEGFNCLDWTLMQLYPPIISRGAKECDVFEALTIELYNSYNTKQIAKVLGQLSTLFKYIVVDEAQVAMAQSPERYDNVDKSAKHPFLFAVIRCFWNIGKNCGMSPILCGTGISIMKMSSIAISAVGEVETRHVRDPDEKYKLQVAISTVLEPQVINALVKEVLVSQAWERHQLGLWSRTLVGRPRILWGFLTLALADTVAGVDDIFKKYCLQMTSDQGMGNSTTTLYSCVSKALARQATGQTVLSQSIGFAVSEMVVNWLTGKKPADLEEEEKVDFIVDCGVCILERKEDKTQLVARLREPMVVQAYLEYIKKSSPDRILRTIMAMLEAATEPSSQGFLFELLFYFALQKWLHGKSLKEAGFAPSDLTSSDFLSEACNIPLESLGNSLLRLPEKPDGSRVSLQSQFLNCHRLYLESETFRPRPRAAATPAKKDTNDLVFVALTENYVLVFLIQCKLEQNTDYLKAAQTTFPDLLLHQSKKRRLDTAAEFGRKNIYDYEMADANKVEYNKLQDLFGMEKWGDRKVCVVQLVVAYPAKVSKLGDTRWIAKPSRRCSTSEELAALLERVPEANEEKRLLVVVKEKLLQQLLGDHVFGRLKEVKALKAIEGHTFDVPMSLSDLLPYEDSTGTVHDKEE